jgi:hypothetical protein
MSKPTEKRWRAKTGLNYRHKDTGEETRVEAGDEAHGLNEVAERNESVAGNIEEIIVKAKEQK